MIEDILERYEEDDLLKADGFDDAIIGVSAGSSGPLKLIYSVTKCIEILMKDMEYEEAMDHFGFNVAGSYVGDKTPIWCWDDFE